MLGIAPGCEILMASCIRIGAVNYLNTKPLIDDLAEFAPESTFGWRRRADWRSGCTAVNSTSP